MVARQLAAAIAKRRALGLPNGETSAYRLVHGASDELEGLTVDVYDRYLVASLYTEQLAAREQTWIAALAELPFAGVYVKQRPRQANELSEGERRERAPEHALVGDDAPAELLVRERGVPFEVRLADGFSTGLFLDQRDNRARVAAEARGKSVLNLFAYTCAFGVSAAVGGASRTVNIDVSKPALERGRRNYELSHLPLAAHLFLARDVFEALPRLARRGERFDLVVLDPPSYATTKRGRFRAEHDYPELLTIALELVAEGGQLLACTNHQKLSEQALVRAVASAEKAARKRIRALEFAPPPADHSALPGRVPHLKSAWIRI